jgi:glyoxylate reductase
MSRPKPKVFVTRNIPEPGLSILHQNCNVHIHSGMVVPRQELMRKMKEYDAILCMLGDRIDSKLIESAGSKLKIISCYSVGYDYVDIGAASKKEIIVTNTPHVLAHTTADLTFSLILSVARNIVTADTYIRTKKWKFGWMPELFLGYDVYGSTLGIIGLGEIGSLVAKRAKGFNMNVLYYSRSRNFDLELGIGIKYCSLERLMKESDFISIHVDLNKDSLHLIDNKKIGLMKKTAFIINTSRGKIINENHLIDALKNGRIAGAGLDVYDREPILHSNPLLKMSNVVILPHIGSATYHTRSKMSEIAVYNILNFFRNKKPVYQVN